MSGPSPAGPGPDSLPTAPVPAGRPAGASARTWGDLPPGELGEHSRDEAGPGNPDTDVDDERVAAGGRNGARDAARGGRPAPEAPAGRNGAPVGMRTGAAPLRRPGAPTARPGLTARLRTGWQSARRAGGEWLDRPMTSLHLVLAVFVLLLGFGLLMVLASSSVGAFRRQGSSFAVFQNQATFATVGLLGFFLTQYLPVRVMRSMSTWAVIGSLLLLVVVLIPGVGAKLNGARSWIDLGTLSFQPAEVAKLALLLWAAHVLTSRRHMLGSVKALLVPVLPVFLLMGALLMAQPDLGTTVALSIVFFAVLYFAGAPGWLFGVVAGLGVAGLCGLALAAPYRLKRIVSFLNPEGAGDAGYQLRQSLYGMGNGGWFGVGLGQSRAKFGYLPNADSDFVYAIVGEELGIVGAGLVLVLFGLLAYTGLRIARRSVDPFAKIVSSAATVWLVGQAAINIGYVIGLLPVTGIPLPMISVGGTSLIITMLVFGLLANFARREPEALVATNAGEGGRLTRFLGLRPDGAAALRSRRLERRQQRAERRENGAATSSWRGRAAPPVRPTESRAGRPGPVDAGRVSSRPPLDPGRAVQRRPAANGGEWRPTPRGTAEDPRDPRARASRRAGAGGSRPVVPRNTVGGSRRTDPRRSVPGGDPR